MDGEGLGRLSLTEIGQMLKDVAWREVKRGWETICIGLEAGEENGGKVLSYN